MRASGGGSLCCVTAVLPSAPNRHAIAAAGLTPPLLPKPSSSQNTHIKEEERISTAARVVGESCAAIRVTVLPPLKLVGEGAIVRRSYCCSCSILFFSAPASGFTIARVSAAMGIAVGVVGNQRWSYPKILFIIGINVAITPVNAATRMYALVSGLCSSEYQSCCSIPIFLLVRLVLFYNQYSDYCSFDDMFYFALAFASASIKFPSKVAVATTRVVGDAAAIPVVLE
ncbi:uncharacterized protein DS421_11g328790 [Arachis hypogaea]|nr:uncharacterized protein DS421_11g328790 [Arachis hypogaea]